MSGLALRRAARHSFEEEASDVLSGEDFSDAAASDEAFVSEPWDLPASLEPESDFELDPFAPLRT